MLNKPPLAWLPALLPALSLLSSSFRRPSTFSCLSLMTSIMNAATMSSNIAGRGRLAIIEPMPPLLRVMPVN